MQLASKLIIVIFIFLALATSAYAESPREQLKQMVEQLQKAPNDNALREKIIKLATSIKPAPVIPEEANRAFVKGNIFKEAAKDASGYELAISAYREAVHSAPWWGDAYFNLAVTLMLAEKFDEAIASLKLYMASVPAGSAEARDAQNRIYAIEAKKVLAVKQQEDDAKAQRAEVERRENSPEGRARREDELIRSLDGAIFADNAGHGFEQQFVVTGRQLKVMNRRIASNVCDCGGCSGSVGEITFCRAIPLNGRVATTAPDVQRKESGIKYTIAQDGRSITEIWINYWDGSDSSGTLRIHNRR